MCQLDWSPPENAKYLFKRCRSLKHIINTFTVKYNRILPSRFAKGENEGQRPRLFTIINPVSSSKLPSFLQLWDTSSFLLVKSVAFNSSPLSALATSPCGKFVAVGSMFGGTVNIYTAFNLQVFFSDIGNDLYQMHF